MPQLIFVKNHKKIKTFQNVTINQTSILLSCFNLNNCTNFLHQFNFVLKQETKVYHNIRVTQIIRWIAALKWQFQNLKFHLFSNTKIKVESTLYLFKARTDESLFCDHRKLQTKAAFLPPSKTIVHFVRARIHTLTHSLTHTLTHSLPLSLTLFTSISLSISLSLPPSLTNKPLHAFQPTLVPIRGNLVPGMYPYTLGLQGWSIIR